MVEVKTNLQVIILVIAFFECESAALLRTPKVYNALITTDQNLTPSRAYPVATIHDSPFIYGPYGYTPYSYYDPFGYNPFESASFVPKFSTDGPVNGAIGGGGAASVSVASAAAAASAADANTASRSANGPLKDDRSVIHGGSTEKPPIPLNEFGFPPSLIPLSAAGNGKNPINLAPFSYNSYPLIYDQFAGYPHSQYLPHFGVIPQSVYGGFGGTTQPTVINGITPNTVIPDANGNGNGAGAAEAAAAEAEAAAAESQNNANNNANSDDAANRNGQFDDSTIDRQRGNSAQSSVYFDRENGVSQGGNGVGDDANNGGFRTAASNGIGSTDRQRGSSAASESIFSSGGRLNGASNGKQANNNQDNFRRTSSSTSGSTISSSSSSSSSATSNGSQQARFVSGTQNGHVKA